MANEKTIPEEKVIRRLLRRTSTWSPEVRGYVALGIGLGLFLFSIGYLQFLHVAIGALGLALMIWGTFTSKILDTLKNWFDYARRRLS